MSATATAERAAPERDRGRGRDAPSGAIRLASPVPGAARYREGAPSLRIGAALQAKVAVGEPGDRYEQEADGVARDLQNGDTVQRISRVPEAARSGLAQRQAKDEPREGVEAAEAPQAETQTGEEELAQTFVQRQAGGDTATAAEEPEAPEETPAANEAEPEVAQTLIQRCGATACNCSPEEHAAKEGGNAAVLQPAGRPAGAAVAEPEVRGALDSSGGGEPLRGGVRQWLEHGTGYDLGDVRVHQGALSQAANHGLRSRAFTHGRDIWLGAGESPDDMKLMGHESAHVVQQSGLPGGVQLVQRSPADYRHPEDGGNIRGRLDRRFDEIDRSQAEEDGEPARRIDRRELHENSAALGGATRPDVDRPGEEAPRIDAAATTVAEEAATPPTPLVPGKEAGEPKAAEAKKSPDPAQLAATRAAGAYGAADAQPQPGEEAEVQPPEPVDAPVDAGGEPLDPDPEADQQAADLAARAQSLREQGTALRAQAAEAHANADIMRGNIAKVSGEVSKAEEGIAKGKEHTTYRREVVGQTDQALGVSKEKQARVASEVPGFQSKADEGKEDSGPMAGEARSLAADNAANAPDDDEAAEKSREQGAKIERVGNDAGTMDSAVTQTRSRADSLEQDAAHAAELNTQTQDKVTTSRAKLDEVTGRLAEHTTQTAEARAEVSGLAGAPARLHVQADSLDAAGLQVIATSYELEANLHAAQGAYAEQMAAVPPIRPYEGEVPENVEPASGMVREAAEAGVLAADVGVGGPESEAAGEAPDEAEAPTVEEPVQRQPDERALSTSGVESDVATAPEADASAGAQLEPGPDAGTAAAPLQAGAAATTSAPAGTAATPFATTPQISGPVPARATGAEGIAADDEAAALEDQSGQQERPGGPEGDAEGGAEGGVEGGGAGAAGGAEGGAGGADGGGGAGGGADEPVAPLEGAPAPTQGREQVDVMRRIPGWLTGVDPQSADQHAGGEDQANDTRRAELTRINQLAGGRAVSELSAGERLGIAGRLVLGRYADTVKGIKWPGWGGLAKMLLDPRSMLTGAVGGLQMILSGGANLFSLAQWRRDPLGNLLKSAADIATGLAIILASITALAGLVAAIMGALIIITFGAASPIALPVISVCTTIITTVGGWTIAVGKVALVLQALSLIKNLIDAATAQTAEELQREAGEIQSDINGGAQAVMSIAGAKGSMAGIRNVRNRVAGVLRGARRAGGAGGLARATLRAAPGAIRRAPGRAAAAVGRRVVGGARAVGRGAQAVGRGVVRGGQAVGRAVVEGGRAVARGGRTAAQAVASGARAVGRTVRSLPGRAREGVRNLGQRIRGLRRRRDAIRQNRTALEPGGRRPASALESRHVNAELDVVGHSQPRTLRGGAYDAEVKLPNGHAWRRNRSTGAWCRFSKTPSLCTLPEVQLVREQRALARNIFDELDSNGLLNTGRLDRSGAPIKRTLLVTQNAQGQNVVVISGSALADPARAAAGELGHIVPPLQPPPVVRATYPGFRFQDGHHLHAEVHAGTSGLFGGGQPWAVVPYEVCPVCRGAVRRIPTSGRQIVAGPRQLVIFENGRERLVNL